MRSDLTTARDHLDVASEPAASAGSAPAHLHVRDGRRIGACAGPQPLRVSGARLSPSWRDWRDLLTLVLRGRCRRMLGRLGLISPERQLAALEADLPAFERLRAVAAPTRS